MSRPLTPDLCVIGAGTGGLTAASLGAQFGAKTVLIESGKMGGECLNTGCVPSKALLAAARRAHAVRASSSFGIDASEPQIHFDRVHAHVHRVIGEIAPHDSEQRFERMGVEVIREAAHFVGEREIVAGSTRIHARRVIVATGSKPRTPPIEGLDKVPRFTNEDVFDNTRLPSHLGVLGGGPLGLELAQAHRRLGAKVTVIESSAAMDKDEPELAERLVKRLAAEGIAIRTHAKVTRVEPDSGSGHVLTMDEAGQKSRLEVSHLLVATGRQARTEALGLDAAGIAHDEKGIHVDRRLRTSARGVYAIGDVVAGAPRFTHIAAYDAGIAIRNALFRLPSKVNYHALPWVTYTDPELAHTGMTEQDARKAHRDDVSVASFAFDDNDRAHAERETEGLVKLVARRNGRILGASILGAHAGELIHLWVLAIERSLKVQDIARMIAPYPTLGETGKSVAVELLKPKLLNRWTRGWVRAMSRLP